MTTHEDSYEVNIIFRGLFLANLTDAGLAILMPDGREPEGLAPDEDLAECLTRAKFKDKDRTKLEDCKSLEQCEEVLAECIENLEGCEQCLEDALTKGLPYLEHQGILEFHLADWVNPSPVLRNLL